MHISLIEAFVETTFRSSFLLYWGSVRKDHISLQSQSFSSSSGNTFPDNIINSPLLVGSHLVSLTPLILPP